MSARPVPIRAPVDPLERLMGELAETQARERAILDEIRLHLTIQTRTAAADEPLYVSVQYVAKKLGISVQMVMQRIHERQLEVVRQGRKLSIPMASYLRYVEMLEEGKA